MDPRDFHRLASDLVKHTAAAELRTAISRAYYTTYLVALNTLRGMGCVIPENYTSHKEVVHRLSNSKNVEVERVGSQL